MSSQSIEYGEGLRSWEDLPLIDRVRIRSTIKRVNLINWYKDSLPRFIAWRLPKRVLYWALVRGWANATGGNVAPDTVDMQTLLNRNDPRLKDWESQMEATIKDPKNRPQGGQ